MAPGSYYDVVYVSFLMSIQNMHLHALSFPERERNDSQPGLRLTLNKIIWLDNFVPCNP